MSEKMAWAAGIFEGEGCFFSGPRYRGGRAYGRLTLQMTDEDVVRRFHLIVNAGHLRGPLTRVDRPDDKPVWRWEASSKSDALSVARRFLPYLGERRRGKAIELFPELLDAEIPFPEELNYLEDVL